MMASIFNHLTPEGKKYFEELKKLEQMEVRIGYQAGETKYEDTGADLVEIAAFNELGSSTTPPRPFMRQSFENHEPELHAICEAANKSITNGGTAEAALQKIGVACKGLVQEEIKNGEFEPNAPSTIKRKGSDRPLIDSGLMRQSVNFVITKRSK